MSTGSLRLLAVGIWLIAVVFGIVYSANYEQYALYRDGLAVEATVTGARERRDGRVQVEIRYLEPGGERKTEMARPGAVADYPQGKKLALLLHQNNGQPLVASELDDKKPSILWLLGAIAALALGVYTWLAPRRAAKRRARRTSPLEPIVDAAARTRNVSIGLAVFCLAAAGFFAIIPLYDTETGSGGAIAIWVLAAITAALALFLLRQAFRLRDPRRNPIVELIEQHPDRIESFAVKRIVHKGFETLSLELRPRGGKPLTLSMVREDLDAVIAEIRRRAPHATQNEPR